MNRSFVRLRPVFVSFFILLFLSAYAEAQPGYRNTHRNSHYYRDQRYYRGFNGPSLRIGFRGVPYQYYSGSFYRPYGGYYQRVAPPFGIHINVLPYGYRRISLNAGLFFYFNGIFYRQHPDHYYEVVAPPLGAVIADIPSAAKIVVINDQTYYQLDGTFYQQEIRNDGTWYRVVGRNGVIKTPGTNDTPESAAPSLHVGDQFDQLPSDCKVIVLNGQKYFKSPDDVYYQEIIDGNTVLYEIASLPDDY